MDLEIIRAAVGWCTIINFGSILFWFLIFALAHDLIFRFHGKWFVMPVEKFNVIYYSAKAVFKCGILLFNLVPYLALRLVG
jgi:hypothetical protein